MVVRCPGCKTAYRLDEARVPQSGVRVRCPRCAQVFKLMSAAPPQPAAPTPPRDESPGLPGLERDLRQPPRLRPPVKSAPADAPAAAPRPRAAWSAEPERTLDLEPPRSTPARQARLETAPFRPGAAADEHDSGPGLAAAPPLAPPTPSLTPPTPSLSPPGGRSHDRAQRLARVLVSDILVYNQEIRDRALREGTLPSALAGEIDRAWQLYKSKVGPELASGSTYFKDALNDILADGARIF